MAETEKQPRRLVVASGRGAFLIDADGREYFDLSMGYGAVWLGHNNPLVREELVTQLDRYAAPGYFPTRAHEAAEHAIARLIPDTHFLGGIYSTGMEAVEAALRAARVHTGHSGMAGFEGSTYGRSLLTSALGGEAGAVDLSPVFCLPAFQHARPRDIEAAVDALTRACGLAAIIVEPILMSGGGYEIGSETLHLLHSMAAERNFTLMFDETLTGLYRCGRRFFFENVDDVPDVFVIGKGVANGFPAAAVILRKGYAWDRARVKPSSTFWNHPLACAAISATLGQITAASAVEAVGRIEETIRTQLAGLDLRGRGAMWCLGFPDIDKQGLFAARLLDAGMVVSYYDRYIRLLPGLHVDIGNLAAACADIKRIYADTFR